MVSPLTTAEVHAAGIQASDAGIGDSATYRRFLVRCGNKRCKPCRVKPTHGPYWYAEWKDSKGKTRTKYVGKFLPLAIARYVSYCTTNSSHPEQRKTHEQAVLELGLRDGHRRRVIKLAPDPRKTIINASSELECGHREYSRWNSKLDRDLRLGDFIECTDCLLADRRGQSFAEIVLERIRPKKHRRASAR